jgi:hypothetical protein
LKESGNILIAPLEWGLGHAARMIPVAAELLKLNHNVIIASGEEHLDLIRSELPECTFLLFPGFNPRYSRYLPQYLSMFLKIPLLVYHIFLEHIRLKRIIKEYSVDIVISDNRFGLWNNSIKTVYVTHMPLIPFPKIFKFLEPAGVILHRLIIRKYDLCFIPDLPGEINISGRLSHGIRLPGNVRYIGTLSRFNLNNLTDNKPEETGYNTVILSGPEPQREILKQKLISIFRNREEVTIIMEGKPGKEEFKNRIGNIILYNHLPSGKFRNIVAGSELVISRSGYSTIMDILALNCTALLIPTPGQTEQEYLAEYLEERGLISFIRQKDLNENIPKTGKKSNVAAEIIGESRILLNKALSELSDKPQKQSKAKISEEKS